MNCLLFKTTVDQSIGRPFQHAVDLLRQLQGGCSLEPGWFLSNPGKINQWYPCSIHAWNWSQGIKKNDYFEASNLWEQYQPRNWTPGLWVTAAQTFHLTAELETTWSCQIKDNVELKIMSSWRQCRAEDNVELKIMSSWRQFVGLKTMSSWR